MGREALPDFGGDQVRGEHVGHPRCGLTVEKQDAGNAGHLAAVGRLERVGSSLAGQSVSGAFMRRWERG